MARTAMKKYKIAVGICGPTILYSNVIKAHSAEEAVDKFIAESEGHYSESDKETLMRHVHETGVRKVKKSDAERTSMKDYDLNEVKVGDQVAFICGRRNDKGFRRYSIQKGVIQSFSDSSAVIGCADLGQTFRIVETLGTYHGNAHDEARLKKVALLNEFTMAESEDDHTDGLGQELQIGDTVAYMADINQDSCAGFIKGTVTKVSAKFAEMDGSQKKTYEKIVKL